MKYWKLRDKNTVFFDVDDTLILDVHNTDPDAESALVIGGALFKPHLPHIEQMKKHKARGHNVIVWSQAGSDWAAKVITVLKLRKYVDLIIPKPHWYYDDLPTSVFMPESTRYWYDPILGVKR